MAGLSGILSGIDTSTLISQLMEIEKATLDVYETRKQTAKEKSDALTELESLIGKLQTTAENLFDYDKLKSYTSKTSDEDIVTAEASSDSFEGNHTVQINQLANAERWVHADGLEYAEDYVGAGTFIYSYNNKEAVITTTEDTTLEDLVNLINNDAANPGVSANLLYYDDAYHLVLNGQDAGSDYEISVNSSNTEVWKAGSEFTVNGENAAASSLLTDLDQFEGTLSGNEVIQITGTDHNGDAILQVDLSVTRNTKISHIISEINDAYEGIATARYENGEIILTDLTSGTSGLTISLNYYDPDGASGSSLDIPSMAQITEGGTVDASLSGFEQSDFTETQSAQDAQIRVDGYPSDDWISRSSNTIDDVIQGVTLHLHDTGTVEVNLTRNIESVTEKMNLMVSAYNNVISYVAENTGYDSATGTSGILQGDYIVNNIKTELRSPLISKTDGFVVDIDSFLNPTYLGLELDRDGRLTFDESVFKEAIAEDYIGVLKLIGSDKTGSSDSNYIQFYDSSSKYTTAGTYDVVAEYDAAGNLSSVKIKLENESEYRQMTIDGNVAVGNSTFSNGSAVYPENNLALTVPTTWQQPNGSVTAKVYVKQGFSGKMLDSIGRMTKYTTGTLQIDQKETSDKIDEIQDKIDKEQVRLDAKEARLTARYARLEKQLAIIQSQQAALGLSTQSLSKS